MALFAVLFWIMESFGSPAWMPAPDVYSTGRNAVIMKVDQVNGNVLPPRPRIDGPIIIIDDTHFTPPMRKSF